MFNDERWVFGGSLKPFYVYLITGDFRLNRIKYAAEMKKNPGSSNVYLVLMLFIALLFPGIR